MALVLADRVKDTTTSTGTGTITLAGAPPAGFQSFAAIGNGNTTYYTIAGGSQWEVGIGTYTSSGTTLSRDTVLSSSSGTSLVDFSAGTKDVFVTYPAERSVYEDASGNININITGSAANLAGGASGSIPYQSGANATTFLASGTGVLVNSAGNPSYSMTPSLTQVTVAGNPSTDLQVATKQYVDGLVSSGITYHAPVKYEVPSTTGNLNALYNQPGGAGVGVGATLTNNGTKAAFAPDGPTASVNDRVLIYNQTNAFENGVYTVTTVGTPDPGGTNWVLTRATDADTYGLKSPNSLGNGDAFYITAGDTGAGETYVVNTVGTITFGTTAITFVQISDSTLYTAGNGLQLTSGTVFSLISPVVTSNGGTGLTSFTSGGAVYATSTSALTTGTLPVASGGTGATTLTGVLKGNGTSAFTASAVALGSEVSGTLPVGNGGTGATTLTANNVLLGNGASALQVVAPGTAGNVLTSNGTTWSSTAPAAPGGPTLTAVASGSLSDGSRVIINADGTVSVVALTAANPPVVGTPAVFRSNTTEFISATYDANAQKVVIAYQDFSASRQGTAVVGTVSGTTISFGTPVVFSGAETNSIAVVYNAIAQKVVVAYRSVPDSNWGLAKVGTISGTSISFGGVAVFATSNSTLISAAYDANAQRVVISYENVDNSSFGTAVVGTVSGTTISFGTPVVFRSASVAFGAGIPITYDVNAQKVVIAFRDNGSGSTARAIVGTVSGTSISFGALSSTFSSGSAFALSATYDANTQKVLIAYRDGGNSFFGTVNVGTVSGTSISLGARVVFASTRVDYTSFAYDTNSQRAVIVYQDFTNSSSITAIAGTVSGTSMSFGTTVLLGSATSSGTQIISATYDSAQQQVVAAYRNNTNSGFGTAAVIQTATTNLTSENFIGFSNAAYTNGQTATIQIVGSVDDAQSGLTPGQSYYVQSDGTLGLTPGTPSVFAGTAVAATKIIVKG
jgi:hypothetical protein